MPYPNKEFKMEEIWIDLSKQSIWKMKEIKIKAIQILSISNSLKFWNSWSKHKIRDLLFFFLNPHAETIHRNTSKTKVLKRNRKEKEILKYHLQSISRQICLTSYLWSSIITNQYMVLTAHYITKGWELRKKVLAFFHFAPPHTNDNLTEKLLSLLKVWGIDKKYS